MAQSKPREAYAVVSLRRSFLEIVVGVELRSGETAEELYAIGRAATVGCVRVAEGVMQGAVDPVPDEFYARLAEAFLLQHHGDRAYYIELSAHCESVERGEYRYHVQLFKPWTSVGAT